MKVRQSKLLNRRLNTACKNQPELSILRAKLLAIGGIEIVAPPFNDLDIPALIRAGGLIGGKVAIKLMEGSACQNVGKLWFSGRVKLDGIGTGYALSDDGLWRQHCWGARNGKIIETTAPRLRYFGLVMRGRHASLFAFFNCVA